MSNDILKQIDLLDHQLAELRLAVKREQSRELDASDHDPNYIPVMITISQAVAETGISYDYLRKLCLQGKLVHVRAGKKYLINKEKLAEYLNRVGAGA